jgi:exopolysaccharide biosynthesis operon protein EpsL
MRFSLTLLPLLAAYVSLYGQPASADDARVLEVTLSQALSHDSNVFRLAGPSTQSDTISVTAVGLRIDKPYAQQRFQLNATETFTRYASLSRLDSEALDYRAAWLWHLTSRWNGTLTAQRQETLVSFADTQGNQRILRTTDNYGFTLDGAIAGGWHALFGASYNKQKNDQPFLAQPNSRTRNFEAGVKYEAGSGSSVSVIQRLSDGDNQDADAFRQNESELRANWNLTAKSVLLGRVLWIDRQHDVFSARDFSGFAGEFNYVWTPTAKLNFNFGAKRDIAAFFLASPSSSYRVDDSLSFTPSWQPSAKTTMRVRLERMKSKYRGPLGPEPTLRSDIQNSALLDLGWNPHRSVALGASLQRVRRSSNVAIAEFDANIATVSVKFSF